MNITNVRNMSYTETGVIDCEVCVSGEWLPFCATNDDSMSYGVKVYDDAISGVWGEISPYVPATQAMNSDTGNEVMKAQLMANAEAIIAPLARAVKYGIATTEETELLEAWEVYTVKLNRMKTTDTAWPDLP